MNQFDQEVEILRRLVDEYRPFSFGDEAERNVASESLTTKYTGLYEELGKRIQKADCECREARDGLPDEASNAEIDAAAYKDSLVVFEIYGEVDEKLSDIIIELERKDKEFFEMTNPSIKLEDVSSPASKIEPRNSDAKAQEVDDAAFDKMFPLIIYQPDGLDQTADKMKFADEYEEDPGLSGSLDALASFLISQLLDPGSADEESAHEHTAQQSELVNILASLHRPGWPGGPSRHKFDDDFGAKIPTNCHQNIVVDQTADASLKCTEKWLISGWMVEDDDPAPTNDTPAKADVPGYIGALVNFEAVLAVISSLVLFFLQKDDDDGPGPSFARSSGGEPIQSNKIGLTTKPRGGMLGASHSKERNPPSMLPTLQSKRQLFKPLRLFAQSVLLLHLVTGRELRSKKRPKSGKEVKQCRGPNEQVDASRLVNEELDLSTYPDQDEPNPLSDFLVSSWDDLSYVEDPTNLFEDEEPVVIDFEFVDCTVEPEGIAGVCATEYLCSYMTEDACDIFGGAFCPQDSCDDLGFDRFIELNATGVANGSPMKVCIRQSNDETNPNYCKSVKTATTGPTRGRYGEYCIGHEVGSENLDCASLGLDYNVKIPDADMNDVDLCVSLVLPAASCPTPKPEVPGCDIACEIGRGALSIVVGGIGSIPYVGGVLSGLFGWLSGIGSDSLEQVISDVVDYVEDRIAQAESEVALRNVRVIMGTLRNRLENLKGWIDTATDSDPHWMDRFLTYQRLGRR